MKTTQLKEALKSEIRKVLKENEYTNLLENNQNIWNKNKILSLFSDLDFDIEDDSIKYKINPKDKTELIIKFIDEDPEDVQENCETMEEEFGGDDYNFKYNKSNNTISVILSGGEDDNEEDLDETLGINEMARIAKTIKISDLDKAKAVIEKVKDTKKKWIADMIQKVIDAGDEGIAQVALAKALGKVDEFGDGRQQAINPEVRSLLGGDVFTFGAAKMEDKPEVTDVTTDDEDEIITSVPDETEDEEEIDITNDDVEDSEDEDETEADIFLKPDEEETEDEEEVAKKATPNKRIGSKADQLDAVITDMKKLAADYKKAKTDGDKDKEKEIADKLKEKTKLKKDLEKDIQISLGDETDEDEL